MKNQQHQAVGLSLFGFITFFLCYDTIIQSFAAISAAERCLGVPSGSPALFIVWPACISAMAWANVNVPCIGMVDDVERF